MIKKNILKKIQKFKLINKKMNGILELEKERENENPSPIEELNLSMINEKKYWKIEEILPIVLPSKKINPYNTPSLQKKKISSKKPKNEQIMSIAKKLQTLIKIRKSKLKGVCEIRNEIYLETLNELIRQITIDCPQRGIFLANIRDEIEYTLKSFEDLYDNSIGFGTRREIKADENFCELKKKREDLREEIDLLKNEEILLGIELRNLESNVREVGEKEFNRREKEMKFMEIQNSNLEDFLEHVKKNKNPLEIKKNFNKNN